MADPILLWNEIALEANRVSHTNNRGEQAGPPLSARALAIVHLAMYDSFAAMAPATTLPPYLGVGMLPQVPGGAALDAAVAGAAHRALTQLFPSQQPFFDSMLAGAGSIGDPGHGFGVAVADAILADRAGDPSSGSTTYKVSLEPGKHRPDPDNLGQGFHAPDYGKLSNGFAIGVRHHLAAPPFKTNGVSDPTYIQAVKEVRAKGIKPELMGTLPIGVAARDVNESIQGIYWGYDGALELGTPPRLYNQIIRKIAVERGNSPAENAALFTLVNVALADAGILAWEQKYFHNFWRPVVGIREHDDCMGPSLSAVPDDKVDLDCDPAWLPLGAPNTNKIGKNFTPNFPAYPSGHATFGAAALHLTRLFYGDGGRFNEGTLGKDELFKDLSFVSEEFNGISTDNNGAARPKHARAFPGGLWQMIEENGRSRVYLGVHWIFDAFAVDEDDEIDLDQKVDGNAVGGVPLGLITAEDIFDRFKAAQTPGAVSWKSSVVGSTATMAADEGSAETFSSSFQPGTQAR